MAQLAGEAQTLGNGAVLLAAAVDGLDAKSLQARSGWPFCSAHAGRCTAALLFAVCSGRYKRRLRVRSSQPACSSSCKGRMHCRAVHCCTVMDTKHRHTVSCFSKFAGCGCAATGAAGRSRSGVPRNLASRRQGGHGGGSQPRGGEGRPERRQAGGRVRKAVRRRRRRPAQPGASVYPCVVRERNTRGFCADFVSRLTAVLIMLYSANECSYRCDIPSFNAAGGRQEPRRHSRCGGGGSHSVGGGSGEDIA